MCLEFRRVLFRSSFNKITGYDREFPECYESRKLAKDNPELYRERLNEYLKQKYSREFVFQRDSKDLQIPGQESMIGAGKRLAYKAGLGVEWSSHNVRMYRNIF